MHTFSKVDFINYTPCDPVTTGRVKFSGTCSLSTAWCEVFGNQTEDPYLRLTKSRSSPVDYFSKVGREAEVRVEGPSWTFGQFLSEWLELRLK